MPNLYVSSAYLSVCATSGGLDITAPGRRFISTFQQPPQFSRITNYTLHPMHRDTYGALWSNALKLADFFCAIGRAHARQTAFKYKSLHWPHLAPIKCTHHRPIDHLPSIDCPKRQLPADCRPWQWPDGAMAMCLSLSACRLCCLSFREAGVHTRGAPNVNDALFMQNIRIFTRRVVACG